ncbi:MAG: hypothetical protein KBD78_13400 [Oligoflexales bacterium]|nr:hypothetical protein [Oligoflexales bacterium]
MVKPKTVRSFFRLIKKEKSAEYGGAAMEYILVTTFATVVGISALGFVGGVIKEKLNEMADKLGVESTALDFDIFGDSAEP